MFFIPTEVGTTAQIALQFLDYRKKISKIFVRFMILKHLVNL
jgi:hypothetical protein